MAISTAMMAGIAAVTAIAGSAVAAYGQIQTAQAQSSAAKQQQKSAELQGMLAEENSRMAAASKQKEAARAASSQVVSGAGAGINLQSESLLDIMNETSTLYEADRQQLLRTGALQKAAGAYNASAFDTSSTSSYWKAGGTLLSGLGTGITYGNKAGWFD